METEQERLTGLYKDVTDCIPVLLEDNEGLPVSEIYAPLLIEEDLDAMKRTRRPDEPSGSKSLDSVGNVFYVHDRDFDGGEKLSTRILIKGEAGSGKSVFCLKLVESWCQLKQSVNHELMCEKHSKLIRRPNKLQRLLNRLIVRITRRRQGSFEKHSELFCQLEKDDELPELCSESYGSRLPEIPCTQCEMKRCISQFDLLYYVALRDATEGKTSVLDLVCDAVCNKRQNVINRTKCLLDSKNIRCLIVLDGVDEWQNPPGFNGLPKSDGLSDNCVLLWTMRPWKLVHLQLTPKHDDHIVTVSGLSPYSVAKVIENILIRFYGLNGEELKSRFLAYCKKVTDKTIEGILRMPMMLIAACHLWHKEDASSNKSTDSEQSFSITHLYLSLLDLMIQNAARKQSKERCTEQDPSQSVPTVLLLSDRENNPSFHPGLSDILKTFDYVSHFIDMLLPFCELAFTDLMSAETKLVFNKGQLETRLGKSRVDLAHRLGLISQAKVRSDIGRPQSVSVSFYHKSVQELLAAMYMTCGNRDAVTTFCGYCSTLEKVMETANVTMFVVGLDPSLGCRIYEHITNIVNSDSDITNYRQIIRANDRIRQLYRAQCEWYRELTHSQTVTGDTSPPPSLHVTDIYLDWRSDSDTVRLSGDLMSANLGTIVSVWLWCVRHPLHGVVHYLPQCPHLSALHIGDMSNTENLDLLVSVIPRLTQLTTVRYDGRHSDAAADRVVVAAVMSLTQLVWIRLWNVILGDDRMELTDGMTLLRKVELCMVNMTDGAWDSFVSSLLSLPQSVSVVLELTDIDDGTLRRIRTSPHVTITWDDRKRNEYWYERLEFRTVASQTA